MAKVSAVFLLALLTISMLHTPAFGLAKPPTWPPAWLKRIWPGAPKKPPFTPRTVKNAQCPLLCSKVCSKTQYPTKCAMPCLNCCKKCKCIFEGSNCPCKC